MDHLQKQLGLLHKQNKPPLKNFKFLSIPQYLFDVPKLGGGVPNQGFSVGESTPHPALLSAERSCGAGETLLPSGPLGVVKVASHGRNEFSKHRQQGRCWKP